MTTMQERRQAVRKDRSLEGRIGYDGKYRLRCLVLNISAEGAKLSLKFPAILPKEFSEHRQARSPRTLLGAQDMAARQRHRGDRRSDAAGKRPDRRASLRIWRLQRVTLATPALTIQNLKTHSSNCRFRAPL